MNICECGRLYVNFCVHCARKYREELVEQLMDKYNLTVEDLIAKLSYLVNEENMFSALQLALSMKDIRPASKTDITTGGEPLSADLKDVKTRLADKLASFAKSTAAD